MLGLNILLIETSSRNHFTNRKQRNTLVLGSEQELGFGFAISAVSYFNPFFLGVPSNLEGNFSMTLCQLQKSSPKCWKNPPLPT